MFSGIIEATGTIKNLREDHGVVRVFIEKPNDFDDLKIGDSVAVNGICLTVEALEEGHIQCAIGPETLKISGWTVSSLQNRLMNLERSLKFGERVHGHLVLGHVDGRGAVVALKQDGEALLVTVEFPANFAKYIWRKGSISINGVSLTINEATEKTLAVCLIPETLKRTNLVSLKVGDEVNLEIDSYARGLVHSWR